MGVQEWTIVIGVIVGVSALLWMAARWRKRRYDDIYSYDPAEASSDAGSDSDYGTELPSGGARTVGYRDPSDIEAMNDEIRKRADNLKPRLSSMPSAPKEQQALFEEPAELQDSDEAEERVPLLLDPSEEHSETSEKTQPAEDQSEPESVGAEEIGANEENPGAEASGAKASGEKAGGEKASGADEVDEEQVPEPEPEAIIPERQDSPAAEAPHVPDVTVEKPEVPEARKASSAKEKPSRKERKRAAAAEAAPKEPPEIIIINLMTSPETPYEGQPLLRALTELGMRFGDMDIFHYCGKHGDEAPQFRMANLLNPGVFDMENIDELRTHALCFFFELEPELDNMAIYESMLSVISRLKDELGGEMRDDQRSVFTIQMSEHCRNRIRDFRRRHLVKTS